jgi:Zn-dependent peptidase ImmA (M78 family)/DNA-binding XRE family transcriptional regulator
VAFNSSRLSIARKRRVLNKTALAKRIGVDLRTIARWENCESEPTPENVDAIVRVLQFPRGFFYGDDIEEPAAEVTSFRSQKSLSAALRDAALAAGAIGFCIADWVYDRFELPPSKIPDLSSYEPESAARALRQEWELGEKPISNMIQLLESKGVRVFSLAENTMRVNAYSTWRVDTPYIFLNTIKSAECSRFDAAHELGHLVLHQDCKMKGREAEDQANAFARAFLMPKADVLSALPRVRDLQQLIVIKVRWLVSVAALNYRLHKLGIISDWKNRDFCIEIAKKGYNKNEPRPMDRERSLVWEKVLKTLWSERTTQVDIASNLNLPLSEVEGLLFGVLNTSRGTPPTAPRRSLSVVERPVERTTTAATA